MGNYSAKSKYHDDSNKLAVGKMKDETVGVAMKKIVALKQEINSFLVNDSIEHKKAKYLDKNVVAQVSHSEYECFTEQKVFEAFN